MGQMRIGRVDGVGTTFSVQRLVVAIGTVAKAADAPSTTLPFDEDGVMQFPRMAQLSSDLRDLIAAAMKNEGSLTVRYLGDLKPSVYPINTQFFHLNTTTPDGGEFAQIMQKALLESDQQEIVFINLANVRDVKIQVGNRRVIGTSDDLAYLSAFCDTLDAWVNDSASICVRA